MLKEEVTNIEFNIRMGKQIKRLRELLGISQEELAHRTGLTGERAMSTSSISRIERGTQSFHCFRLAAIADALEVEIGDIFKGF